MHKEKLIIKHQLATTLNAMNLKCQQTILNSAKKATTRTTAQETTFDSHLREESSKSESEIDNTVSNCRSLDESSEESLQLDTSMHKPFNEHVLFR